MASTSIEWTQADSERFDRYLERSGACLLWTGGLSDDGYGKFWLRGRTMPAHVFAHARAGGAPGDVVRHKCDVRNCVERTHLLAGTQHDNLLDATERGRIAKTAREAPRLPDKANDGERNGRARVTQADVDEMRLRYRGRESHRSLARAYGISKSQVHNIVTGRQWTA